MKVLHTQRVMNPFLALLGSKRVSIGVVLRQRVEQRLGLLQIRSVKPLSEPVVDRCQEVMGFLAFALLLPQFGKAGGGS